MNRFFTLADLAAALSDSEAPEESVALSQKGLKNLTQRAGVVPAARSGRADLYSLEGACTIRLAADLAALGVGMSAAAGYVSWLSSRVARAVERASVGERFDHIATPAFGLLSFEEHIEDGTGRAASALRQARAAGLAPEPVRSRIVVPASGLIRDTLARLGEG
ncbi:MAG: hypothetical protein V2I65_00125 [Paracoccaceae bacterium]|jgi:hypothetical protein|nr:hypothetical protein [Paracoccaceae bacterium]